MAEECLSDVESDSEFEEVLSADRQRRRSILVSFIGAARFWAGNGLVQGLISKNRFDRLQRLVDLFAQPGNCPANILKNVLGRVLFAAVIKGQDETVRCVFRHLRAMRSVFSVRWISELEEVAVVLALAFDQRSSLDILRDQTFACNYRELVEHLRGPCPCVCLFKASLLGDLEEVKRLLAANNSGSYTWRPFPPLQIDTMLDISAWGATARGHMEVLKELLSYQREVCSVLERKFLLLDVVALASMTNNIPMAAEVINHGAATVDVSQAFRIIFANIGDDPVALDETFSYARRSLDITIHHVNLRSRTVIDKRDPFFIAFSTAVQLRKRRQVGALLEMLLQDEHLWTFSNGLPCSVDDALRARSLPILRKILVDAPHSFVHKDECTYANVWNLQWFAGAHLLLGAGVLSLSAVKHLPPKCAEEFKPSLEEMCQKVIRVNLKHPLSQSVEKLPLPGVVKKGLLFK